MTTTDTTTTDTAAVRAALLELLSAGGHRRAATPTTLTTVGATRAALAERHGTADPTARHAPPERRLAALTTALGVIGHALFTATSPGRPRDTTAAHTGLTQLAAVALAWLDTLPHPDDESPF